jgi:predicted GNAT superfamily acetyltransferase
LFERAVRAGHDRVVCEVVTGPPNATECLPCGAGFVEVGTASVCGSRRFATCRKRYSADLTPRARSRGISPPRP